MNYTQDDLSELRGLGAQERRVFSDLVASEKPTISADDVVERLGVDRTHANLRLSRLSKKGWLQRLKRGVYAPVPISSKTGEPIPEDPFATATVLFAPCYIIRLERRRALGPDRTDFQHGVCFHNTAAAQHGTFGRTR